MNTFQKNQSSSAFTLIELLLSITIAAILFVGILIFVSSSMRQNIIQEKMLKSLTQKWDFSDEFTQILGKTSSVVWSWSTSDGTGVLLRLHGDIPFALVSTETFTGLCDSYSGAENADGSGTKLTLKTFITLNNPHTSWGWYTLDQTGNIISSGSETIGTWAQGDTLTSSWETTELHFPSAIVGTGNILYIADTLNNRILTYDTTTKTITKLLDTNDGIYLPVDILLSGNSLLIANAGNGKILAYQDGSGSSSYFSQEFKVSKDFTFNKIWFAADSGSALSWSTNTGSFSFSGFTQKSNDSVSTSPLIYTFTWSQNTSTGTLYNISINSVAWAPTSTGSHIMKLSFYSGSTLVYKDSLPWYTVGDGQLETPTGNILSILAENLDFPHNLQSDTSWSGTLDYSSFITSTPLETYSSDTPIRNFSYHIESGILTASWEEYTYYDCLTENHKIQDRLYKQFLK